MYKEQDIALWSWLLWGLVSYVVEHLNYCAILLPQPPFCMVQSLARDWTDTGLSQEYMSYVTTVYVCTQPLSLTRCNPMNWILPGSSVHGVSHARILEWVAILYSRGSFRSRERSHLLWAYILYLLKWQMSSLPLGHLGSPFNHRGTSVYVCVLIYIYIYIYFFFNIQICI